MEVVSTVAHHGYLAVWVILFLGAAGLPMPAGPTLLVAGAAAATRGLHFGPLWATAISAAVLGDNLLYLGGRTTGWWLLGRLCRISIDPETCIFASADFFYRRGARTLLFAKFVPGLGTMAAPLCGSLQMRWTRFIRVEAPGVAFYTLVYLTAGYLLHGVVDAVLRVFATLGHVTIALMLIAVGFYAVVWAQSSLRLQKYRKVGRVTAEELRERIENPDPTRPMVIADVRSHGYYDPGMQRIKHSIRVEPSRLPDEIDALRAFMAPECEIYLYCSCLRDATSARVAHVLMERGTNVRIIEGGLRAWEKAGCPTEPVPEADIAHLPRFD